MHRLLIPLFAVFVAGCSLPPALGLASLAADGVSYAATGKSTSDHALSAITSEDCAMLRAVEEKPICVPKAEVSVSELSVKPREEDFSEGEDFDYLDD